MLWYYTCRNFGEKSPQCVSVSPWNLRRASGNVCTRVHRISRTKRHAWRCHQSWTWSASRYCPGLRCTQVRCCKLGWVGNKRTIQERTVGNDKSTNTKVTTRQLNHPISTLCKTVKPSSSPPVELNKHLLYLHLQPPLPQAPENITSPNGSQIQPVMTNSPYQLAQ